MLLEKMGILFGRSRICQVPSQGAMSLVKRETDRARREELFSSFGRSVRVGNMGNNSRVSQADCS